MRFDSVDYFLLLLICFFAIRRSRRPEIVLLACSFAFYLYAGLLDTALICGMIATNWLILRFVANRSLRLPIAVAINLLPLAFFKYSSFGSGGASFADLVIPLGISFYSFQMLSFQFDRTPLGAEGRAPPLIQFALFVGFFPQLVAGPIVRGYQLLPQIRNFVSGRAPPKRLIIFGLLIFLVGLTKKVVFADSLSPIVDGILRSRSWTRQRLGWEHTYSRFKSTLTFLAIPTWQSALPTCSAFDSQSISGRHMSPRFRRIFGADGISPCRPGSEITSTYRWVGVAEPFSAKRS